MSDLIKELEFSEIILFFVLIFIVPIVIILLVRMRKYEKIIEEQVRRIASLNKLDKPEVSNSKVSNTEIKAVDIPLSNYPYKKKVLMSSSEYIFLQQLESILGSNTKVFPKVAIWKLIDPDDKSPIYAGALYNKYVDFLLCDAKTAQPFSVIMMVNSIGDDKNNQKEVVKICSSAGIHLIQIPSQDKYSPEEIKKLLGLE